MEEGLLPSEASMAANPMSRQVSLSYPAPMRYRNLGKSGLRISAMGLGTWVTFGSHISEQSEISCVLRWNRKILCHDLAKK
ncbi:voltage-gated potassium channel subunit beta-2 [Caerostris darwini]|uniref:Voltage-gated potassium channel subunit beta-2 n=1 Tax=Caerostris darwini TaxID=1538125 RepID=A0AAV4RLF2_9ARAC|nr:voltage-gated potassium channel subunit beta-2 [Caerostris darwini]